MAKLKINLHFDKYNANQEEKNIVLTHVNDRSFKKASIAYSNYFLTYNSFVHRIHSEFTELVIHEYKKGMYFRFKKHYQQYLDNARLWFLNFRLETNSVKFESQKLAKKGKLMSADWSYSIYISFLELLLELQKSEVCLNSDISLLPFIMSWKKNQIYNGFKQKLKRAMFDVDNLFKIPEEIHNESKQNMKIS